MAIVKVPAKVDERSAEWGGPVLLNPGNSMRLLGLVVVLMCVRWAGGIGGGACAYAWGSDTDDSWGGV